MDTRCAYSGLNILYHSIGGQVYRGTILSSIDKWTVWIKLSEKIDNLIDRIVCPISQLENDRDFNTSDERDYFCINRKT